MAAQGSEDPWGNYKGVFRVEEQALHEPLDRLTHLPEEPPHQGPDDDEENVDLDAGCEGFLKALRTRATNFVDPELLEDRLDLWSSEPGGPEDAPEHMYLKGKTTQAHLEFHHWISVIKQDLKCDDRSCREFQTLFHTNPPGAPHGFMEANRILAHMLKDKTKTMETLVHQDRDWSAFMAKASKESIEALQNWKDIKDLRREGTSWSDFGQHPVGPPGGSSSSSSTWAGPGKGMGKGKDKGMHAWQQGYR